MGKKPKNPIEQELAGEQQLLSALNESYRSEKEVESKENPNK
ncbi:hypothetical protein [Halobacillus yeomjeoni]|nr:hypothetical protein [Halobacillus yeomjeoni]